MSYESWSDGWYANVPHFSNPNIFFQGQPTGHASHGDNARTLREICHVIAGYRNSTGIVNPGSFMANAVSQSEINLSWNRNGDNNGVMLVWSPNGSFGAPAGGTAYTTGQSIPGGGTVLYWGSNTSFNHSSLNSLTTYYYRAYSYDGSNNYSSGVSTSAFTLSGPLTSFSWTETFEDNSPTRVSWAQQQVSGFKVWSVATGSSDGSITSAYRGTRNARFTASAGGPYITRLVSPVLDLSNLINPELSFWYGQQSWFGDQNELKVYYRTSPVAAWVQIFHDAKERSSWTYKKLTLPNPSATYQIAF